MQAMILCGGSGTRLREETEYRPKPMVEIGGRPILWHIMKIYARRMFRPDELEPAVYSTIGWTRKK
jgi:glucose-1-phosphate cytidylyltransferase